MAPARIGPTRGRVQYGWAADFKVGLTGRRAAHGEGLRRSRGDAAGQRWTLTITTRSIATACAGNRTKVILYWRPIVPGWNDDPATMAAVLATGRAADAIVFTGYYHKEQNASYLRSLVVELPYGQDYNRRKVLPGQLEARVIAGWRDSGISTPLFRKTSCGVSAAHQVADYNGHWGVRELCDICPAAQIGRCVARHRQSAPGELDPVLAGLGYSTEYLIDSGHVGPTTSVSRSAMPSSTAWASRSGNSTSHTCCMPTAGS
jgi:hypothetical protein